MAEKACAQAAVVVGGRVAHRFIGGQVFPCLPETRLRPIRACWWLLSQPSHQYHISVVHYYGVRRCAILRQTLFAAT